MLEIILLISSVLTISVGIPINSFLIFYLRKKPSVKKTALDLVIIDANIAVIIFSILSVCLFVLRVFLTPLSFTHATIFMSVWYLSAHILLNSIFAAMLVKFSYILFGSLMLELPNKVIHNFVKKLKIVMIFILIILDNFGPIKNDPAPWSLISEKDIR